MKILVMFLSVVVASLYAFSAVKAQDYICFARGMDVLIEKDPSFTMKLEHISCRAGRIDLFKGCRRETKQYTLSHSTPEGWLIAPGTAHVYVQGGRYSERTRAILKHVGTNTVDVEYWCQQGCGGQGTSYSDAYLRATLVRSPTSLEVADLRKRCGL